MEMLFMNTENCKTNQPHNFVFNLSQRLAVQKNMLPFKTYLLIHVEKIKKQHKNNKLQIIALTWNDKFELPDGSYSLPNIKGYIEYIKKNTKH